MDLYVMIGISDSEKEHFQLSLVRAMFIQLITVYL